MSAQRGKNRSGLSGVLIDLPGISAAKFHGDCVRWNLKRSGAAKPRRGRGGTYYTAYRYLTSDGGGFIYLEKIDGDWPEPDVFKGQTGSLVHTIHGSRKITVPIMVTVAEYQEDLSKDVAPLVLSYVTTGAAVFTGWPGTQPAATDPTMSDLQLWDGTQFTKDPNNLQDNATIVIDWWGAITDSNAGDVGKLDAKIAQYIAPFAGMKLKTASFTRDSQNGGTIVYNCGHTDTAEDVVNPQTQATTDPYNLTNNATVAAINATPAQPAGAFVRRDTRVSEIHDTAELRVSSFGTRTTKDDVEMPGTFYRPDVSDLESIGKQTFEYQQDVLPVPLPTVPAGLQIVGYTKQNIDQFNATVVYDLGKDTNKQKWEQGNSFTIEDPNGLQSKQTKAGVDALPTLDPGYVVRGIRIVAITHDHNGFIVEGGQRSTIADITYPGSVDDIDPSGLESKATRTDVAGSPAPSTPPNVAGLKVRNSELERIDDYNWRNTHSYGVRTTKEDIEYLRSKTVTESSALKQAAIFARVTNNSTPPGNALNPDTTNLSLYWAESTRNTDGLWVHVVEFRPLTPEEESEEESSHTTTDQSTAMAGDAQRAIIDGNSTAPSGGSAPTVSGRVLQKVTTRRVGKAKYKHVYYFDFRTIADEYEAKLTQTRVDTSSLESTATTADVWLVSGGAPSTPTLSGYVLTGYEDREIDNPLYRIRVYSWGLVTNANKIIYAGSGASANPLTGFESEVVTIESDSTHTDTELTQTALADLQDELTFQEVEYKRLTPNYVRKTVKRTLADKVRHSFSSAVVLDSFRGANYTPRGEYAAVHVFIDGVIIGGGGAIPRGNVIPDYRYRVLQSFKLRRRLMVTSSNTIASYFYPLAIGKVSTASFMGFDPYAVMYVGPDPIGYSDSVSGDRVVEIDYNFKVDSELFVIDGALPIGTVTARNPAMFPGNGWYSAAEIDPSCILRWPEVYQPGFGVFTQ